MNTVSYLQLLFLLYFKIYDTYVPASSEARRPLSIYVQFEGRKVEIAKKI